MWYNSGILWYVSIAAREDLADADRILKLQGVVRIPSWQISCLAHAPQVVSTTSVDGRLDVRPESWTFQHQGKHLDTDDGKRVAAHLYRHARRHRHSEVYERSFS